MSGPKVQLEEKWVKRAGIIYRLWRFENEEWKVEATALTEMPFVKVALKGQP